MGMKITSARYYLNPYPMLEIRFADGRVATFMGEEKWLINGYGFVVLTDAGFKAEQVTYREGPGLPERTMRSATRDPTVLRIVQRYLDYLNTAAPIHIGPVPID